MEENKNNIVSEEAAAEVVEDSAAREISVETTDDSEDGRKEKKIATIVLAVACVLAVASIIAGIFLRVVPAVKSGAEKLKFNLETALADSDGKDAEEVFEEFMEEFESEIESEFAENSDSASVKAFRDKTQTFGNISDIELDMSVGKVKVVSGDENKVTLSAASKKLCPEITCEDGRLYIGQKDVGNIAVPGSIKSIVPHVGNSKVSIEITVKDHLSSFICDTDLGAVEIDGITADEFEIDEDCGDVKIKNCAFGSCEASVDLGNLEIIKCEFNNMELEVNLGNVTVETTGSPEDYTVEADSELGGLEVFGTGYSKGCEVGSGQKKITADCSMGAILIK